MSIVESGTLVSASYAVDLAIASGALALDLDGVELPLVEDEGIIVTVLNLGWPEVRTAAVIRPGRDGVLDSTEHFGARAVSLGVVVFDIPGRRWPETLHLLRRYLAAKSRPILRITAEGMDYRMTLAPDAAPATFEHPFHCELQVGFRAPDPFLYGAEQSVGTTAYRAGTGRTYPWQAPRIYPAGADVSGLIEARNAGTVEAWPLVRIWGPLTSGFSLANLTTGATFVADSITVSAGHFVEISMAEHYVRLNANPDLSRFSRVRFAESRWWSLLPGSNLIRFATTAVEPDVLCDVRWSDPYL